MPSLVLGLVAALTAGAGCVIPFAIPPIRAEVGAAAPVAREAPARVQAAAGAHLASGTTRGDQRFDAGAGYLFAHDAVGPSHGIYLEGARFIERSRRTRTAIGGRAELRWTPAGVTPGAKLRVDHELFGAGQRGFSGSDHCGTVAGTYAGTAAVGVFAETGPQRLPGGELAWSAAAGLTLRIPTAIGVYVGIPGC